MVSALLIAAITYAATAADVTEYVAVVPNHGGPTSGFNGEVSWIRLDYDSDATKASQVKITPVEKSVPEIGSWFNMTMNEKGETDGAFLSAKIRESNMYIYINKGTVPNSGGCCADTMRVFPRGGSHHDIDIAAAINKAMGNTTAYATHTFDVSELKNELTLFMMVQHTESKLNAARTDVVCAVSAATGAIVPTANGDPCFDIFKHAGTTASDDDSTRFKQQFITTGSSGMEQWHGNGVTRFSTLGGTAVLAITQKNRAEATLMKCPWTYSKSQGGGTILQRFGTPTQYGAAAGSTSRHFGIANDTVLCSSGGGGGGSSGGGGGGCGVHNVWYREKDGKETVTLFANGVSTDSYSHVFEFELNLQNGTTSEKGDAIFVTSYQNAAFSFSAQAQGGARPLADGVYIGASGAGSVGYQIVDVNGGLQTFSYTSAPLYDPFARVVVSASA